MVIYDIIVALASVGGVSGLLHNIAISIAIGMASINWAGCITVCIAVLIFLAFAAFPVVCFDF